MTTHKHIMKYLVLSLMQTREVVRAPVRLRMRKGRIGKAGCVEQRVGVGSGRHTLL